MSEPITFHYHIRWSGKTSLDWERFATVEEAISLAAQLARVGEGYSVEKFDDKNCIHCTHLSEDVVRENALRHGQQRKRSGCE